MLVLELSNKEFATFARSLLLAGLLMTAGGSRLLGQTPPQFLGPAYPVLTAGSASTIALNCSNIDANVQVTADSGVTVSNVTFVSSSQVDATFTIPAAAVGSFNITVTDDAINAGAASEGIFNLTSVDPNSGQQGNSSLGVTLNGSGFS